MKQLKCDLCRDGDKKELDFKPLDAMGGQVDFVRGGSHASALS
jgi:hypothetical protein